MDYLNKKQWHTGSIKNIARVWQKEQEATRQIQKQEQYRKKLLEEQHAHELKVAQVEAGHIPKSALEKMDWMYNPIMNTQQDTEQYLLGKQVDMQNLPQQQQQSGNLQDPNDTSNKYQAIVTEDVTNSTCENFTLIHEDPLFKIMQEEIKMKEKLMNNPLDVNMLMEEMRKQKELKKLMNGKDKKSKKKKDKKDKKEKKEKKDRKHRSKDEKESKKKKNKSRSRSRSSHKDKKENGSSKHKKDKKQKKSRSSSSDSSSKSSSSSKSRSPSKDRKNKRRSSRSNSENKKLRQKNRSNSRSLSPESKLKKMHFEQYLKKKVGNILVRDDDGELRPDFGLMKRMHRNNLKPEEKLKMTEEEKRERLKEMQDNAKQVTQDRLQEFKDDYKDIEYDNDASRVKDLHGKQNNPKFINDMNKEIYTGKKDVNSLAHQLSMNKTRLTRNLEEKNTFK